MQYRVILPSSIAPEQKLFAVYLLHGAESSFRAWSNYSDVARFAQKDLILVMPEAGNSYYVNAPGNRYEDYIVENLRHDVEARFPVAAARANRAVVGVSMGGFGAINIAFRHPDLFAFAGGLSSAIDAARRPLSLKRIGQYRALRSIFGPRGGELQRQNDPFELALSAPAETAPYLFLSCGKNEGLLRANRRFAAVLAGTKLKHEFHVAPGGHDWGDWNSQLEDVFESLRQHAADAQSH